MKQSRIVFGIEGLSAKMLRNIHQTLAMHFASVKVIERITDIVFANLTDFDVAILWCPRDREKTESFIRNVRLRSPSIKIQVYCNKMEGLDFSGDVNAQRIQLDKEYSDDKVVDAIVANIMKTGAEEPKSDLGIENESTNMFLGMLLHELNNPISVFSGTLRSLERELKAQHSVAPMIIESLARLERTLWRMEKTVLSVRNLIGQNRDAKLESCSIKELIAYATEAVEFRSVANKTTIQRSGKEVGEILCRKSEVCQILINLLTNAIDAVSDQDTRQVEIQSESTESHVMVKILDNGKGLEPEMLRRLGGPNMSSKPEGMGLGLMISHKLAEHNNSPLTYDKKNGQTCFTLSLPKNPSIQNTVAS